MVDVPAVAVATRAVQPRVEVYDRERYELPAVLAAAVAVTAVRQAAVRLSR